MLQSTSTLTMNALRSLRSRQRRVRMTEDGLGMMVVQEYGGQTACCNGTAGVSLRARNVGQFALLEAVAESIAHPFCVIR